MKAVQEGVSNFVKFQCDMRDFTKEFWTRKDEEEKQAKKDKERQEKKDAHRSRIHFWLLGILASLIVALFVFMLNAINNHHISSTQQSHTTINQPTDASNSAAYANAQGGKP